MSRLDPLRLVCDRRKAEQPERERRYRQLSRERLEGIVATKLRTAFIGALARFEAAFGELWGHGLPLARLTATQAAWRQRWEETRTAVLDNGNAQLRALQAELAQHTVTWERFQTQWPVATHEEEDAKHE